MKKLAVCVPTFNRAELLDRLLNSIPASEEIMVSICDDGSKDNTLEIVQKHQSRISINYVYQLVPEELRSKLLRSRNDLCQDINFKYLIAIDGWVSGWLRGPLILKSNSVPIIVETSFKPLYFEAWVPYVHYIPVKSDMSDLISQI